MFGYVKPRVSDLLVREHEFYRATYCGICRVMKKHTGSLSRVTLTYDSVFLALVRMVFIEDDAISAHRRRCAVHPLRSRVMLRENDALVYTANAFAILSYYKMRDDLADESVAYRIALTPVRPILSRALKRADIEELRSLAAQKLSEIRALEQEGCASVDAPAHIFGELLGGFFSHGLTADAALLTQRCGYYLGRFIYAIDAADDYERDRESGKYNPYVKLYGAAPLTAENKQSIKRALLLECKNLEGVINLMPFGNRHTLEHIIKNIIYFGLVDRMAFLDGDITSSKKKIKKEDQII